MITEKIAPNTLTDYSVENGQIVIHRVYRQSSGYVLNDKSAVDLARWTVQGIRDGWVVVK